MSTWTLLQVAFDIISAVGLFMIFMRLARQPQDDPRLSRGLQLLQSKISVLEDLSDRTESQVGQLSAILEQKTREVQAKIQLAEQHMHEIQVVTEKSLDVAKIFQDKIPHQEIIERRNTIKYVQAARLAHQGRSNDEIAKHVDLPKGEIEFIAKVNREQLMFSEQGLPWWAQELPAEGKTAQSAEAATPAPALVPSLADEAVRLRKELEIAEQQRMIDNLNRLQFEMKSLDQQLVREPSAFDFAETIPSPNLQDTGRFQAASAEVEESRTSLPPLSRISELLPQIFNEGSLSFLDRKSTVEAPQTEPPKPAPVASPKRAEPVPDQDQVRKLAREKARGQARALTSPYPVNQVNKSQNPPEVRKVEFPRIESTSFKSR